MTERQRMHIVVQDPTLVVYASHESLCLFLPAYIEGLVVDALEATFDYCTSLLLCLKYTLVQFDVLHAYFLTIEYDIARYSLCCVVYDVLFINQTVHLGSESHELCNAMSVVLVFEYWSRQLLVEI